MRSLLLAALAAAVLATAGAGGAHAGPAPAAQIGGVPAIAPVSEPADPTPFQVVCLVAFVGGLFTLIALMPDFDGWESGDGGEVGGDE